MFHLDYQDPSNPALKCFHCGESNTHVQGLAWFRRPEDNDSCKTIVADMNNSDVMTTTNKNNPSARRDGMHIVYDCENCKELSSLVIAQHKGATYINIVDCPHDLLSKSFVADDVKWGL